MVKLIVRPSFALDGSVTPSQILAYCARVSSEANQNNHVTGPKLLRFLVKRKEWSPLEMVSLTMEIETTRDIARQILRHRSFSFQEFSQRYAVADERPILRETRMQDTKDRQNSLPCSDEELNDWWVEQQAALANDTQHVYHEALKRGVAKEVARSILPEGMTPTRMYMAGSLRSWLHYVMLRCDRKTQKEHREIALEIRGILIEEFPDIADLLLENMNDD